MYTLKTVAVIMKVMKTTTDGIQAFRLIFPIYVNCQSTSQNYIRMGPFSVLTVFVGVISCFWCARQNSVVFQRTVK